MKFKVFCVLLFSSLAVIFLYSKYLNVVEPETEENLLSGIAFESLSEPNFFNPNKIAIIVINEGNDLSNYRLAVDTIKCYALQYNYTYVILNQKDSPRYASNCKQGDFMYRRHCILANFVEIHEKSINTVVFVDADMGIINPLHRLEEYIPKDLEHMYFYERMFNFEIACGSVILFYVFNY
uniref:Glycosyltransferase n=1 Tax=Rhabditophanes sp. KR3021 TaxID=114890 RepID=A0AC35UHD0_9BILA